MCNTLQPNSIPKQMAYIYRQKCHYKIPHHSSERNDTNVNVNITCDIKNSVFQDLLFFRGFFWEGAPKKGRKGKKGKK